MSGGQLESLPISVFFNLVQRDPDTNNIISIGDAIHEYNALIELYKYQNGYLDRYLKTIKLNLVQLITEINS